MIEHLSDNASVTICIVAVLIVVGVLATLGIWTSHIEEKLKIAAGFSSREKDAERKLEAVRKIVA